MEPVLGIHDITVLPFATATKLLFDEADPKSKAVVGVQVNRFGETLNYFAKKETILSGGAMGEPL